MTQFSHRKDTPWIGEGSLSQWISTVWGYVNELPHFKLAYSMSIHTSVTSHAPLSSHDSFKLRVLC